MNIKLSADSTCDLGTELISRYNVSIRPLFVCYGDTAYLDGVDIDQQQIYDRYFKDHELPKTGAVNIVDYKEYFEKLTQDGSEVIHFSIGSGLSSTYQNACLAASAVKGVHVVDTKNLSTGSGLLVLEAADRLEKGLSAEQIAAEVSALTPYSKASFVVPSTEFLRAGGRCSALASFGANLLNIRPEIVVKDDLCGGMVPGKKYRGSMDKVLVKYTHDLLSSFDNIDTRRVFVTHSGIDEDLCELVRKTVRETVAFDEMYTTTASCTISAHCGPGTLGVLFMTKPEG